MELITEFLQTQWLSLIGVAIALIALYYTIKNISSKKIGYTMDSINVISDKLKKIPTVEIFYHKNKVDNLTVTKFGYWNLGNRIINYSDVETVNKFKIVPREDTFIYSIEMIKQSSEENLFSAGIDGNSHVFFSFQYIEPRQGCIYKIIHTGKDSTSLDISGKFKDVKIKKMIEPLREKLDLNIHFTLSFILFVMGFFYIGIISSENPVSFWDYFKHISNVLFTILLFLLPILFLVVYFYNRYLLKKMKVFYDID